MSESANELAAPTGSASWVEWIESANKSADRYGDRDVVPASMARQLAARLDECQKMQRMLIESMTPNDKLRHGGENQNV